MEKPYITALAYSAGKQSSAILWMVLRGELPRPKVFSDFSREIREVKYIIPDVFYCIMEGIMILLATIFLPLWLPVYLWVLISEALDR